MADQLLIFSFSLWPRLKIAFGDFDDVAWKYWNRRRYGILAHLRFAAPLDFNVIAACSVCGTPSDSYRSKNVETASVVKLARLLHFANYVKGCEGRDRNSDFGIPQIFGAKFLGQRLLELSLCHALRFDGARQRH